MEEPLLRIVQLYDMGGTLVGDCSVPVSRHSIELLTLGDRYFIYDVLTDTYKEVMRYHVSQMNN